MNYLAHCYLAGDAPEALIGNLMGDFIKGRVDDQPLPAGVRAGIVLHRKIDVYTDNHRVFNTSRRRLRPEYRRYGGVLVDVFYDHFLARDWERYSSVSLASFSRRVYRTLARHQSLFPEPMQRSVAHMIGNDLLLSYRELAGVGRALRGIAGRLKRTNRLARAITELESNYGALGEDFAVFFPELVDFVRHSCRNPMT